MIAYLEPPTIPPELTIAAYRCARLTSVGGARSRRERWIGALSRGPADQSQTSAPSSATRQRLPLTQPRH